MTDTEFAYILNPDARFRKNTFLNLIKDLKKLDNFAIVSPISSNIEKPNYYKNQIEHEDKNFLSVNFIFLSSIPVILDSYYCLFFLTLTPMPPIFVVL